MQLWKKFLIVGVVLSVAGCVLFPISQIRMEITEKRYAEQIYITPTEEPVTAYWLLGSYAYPYSWLLLPATIIVTTGIVSILYGYLVKRTYG